VSLAGPLVGMQAWIVGYRLGPPMPAKPNDERCVTRCHRECSFLPPEVQPPMLLPGPIAGFLVEQHAATKTAIPSIKLRRCTAAPKAQSLCGLCFGMTQLQQGITTCGMGSPLSFCAAAILRTECPLWVKSRHRSTIGPCTLYPSTRTWPSTSVMSALCQ